MGKASRTKRRASVSAARRNRSGLGWYALAGVVIVAGVVGIALSRSSNADTPPLVNKDHWHAAIGVNVCGEWLPNAPQFEDAEGLHTHGDGLMHIHPFLSRAAGKNATVGNYFKLGGWSANANSFRLWDDTAHKTGDKCDGKAADVRWEVNGKPKTGDISDYRPEDGDVVALALLPEGDEIGTPPSKSELAAPSDVAGSGEIPPNDTTPTTGAGAVPGDTTPSSGAPPAPAPSAPTP
jgi:hypothetical protein